MWRWVVWSLIWSLASSQEEKCLNPSIKEEMEKEIQSLERTQQEKDQIVQDCRATTGRLQGDVDRLSMSVKELKEQNMEYAAKLKETQQTIEMKEGVHTDLHKTRELLKDARGRIHELEEGQRQSESKREADLKQSLHAMQEEIKHLKARQGNPPSVDLSTWASSQMDILRTYDYEALVAGILDQATQALKDGAHTANVYVDRLNVQTEPVRKYCAEEMDKYTTVVLDAYDTHCREHIDPVLASIEPHINASIPKVKRSWSKVQDWVMKIARENRKKAIAALSDSKQSWAKSHASEIVDFVIGGCMAPLVLLALMGAYKVALILLGLMCCCWCCGTRRPKTSRKRKGRSGKRGNKLHKD